MINCFISTYPGQHQAVADLLVDELGFRHVQFKGRTYPSISNKWVLFKKEFVNCVNAIRHIKEINKSNVLICSNYVVLFLMFLRRISILKVGTLIWYGMFIHSPKMVVAIGKIIKILYKKEQKFRIMLFSKAEIELYASTWHIPKDTFISVPLGEWNQEVDRKSKRERAYDKGYFFSGGYSNRDYISLIKLFDNRQERLVIAASKHNRDLIEYVEHNDISDNITLFYDISQKDFTYLLEESHAVIFIMKHNTGASGQLVVLNAMKYKKLVIATKTDVLSEYIEDNISGIVVEKEEMFSMLPQIISDVDIDIGAYRDLIENAYEKYESIYSYTAISKYLIACVKGLLKTDKTIN